MGLGDLIYPFLYLADKRYFDMAQHLDDIHLADMHLADNFEEAHIQVPLVLNTEVPATEQSLVV